MQILLAGHLIALVEIVDRVKDGVFGIDFDNRPVGEDLAYAGFEERPLHRAVEIVAHEEAAAQQVFAHGGRLGVGQLPVTHFHAVEPRAIVNVAVIQIRGLPRPTAHGCASDGGRPPKDGGRSADSPWSNSFHPVSSYRKTRPLRCVDPRVDTSGGRRPIGRFIGVGRDGVVGIFEARVFLKRLLPGVEACQKGEKADQ